MGAHNIYIGKKDRELERWVEDHIDEGRFASWSHAAIWALKRLRSQMTSDTF